VIKQANIKSWSDVCRRMGIDVSQNNITGRISKWVEKNHIPSFFDYLLGTRNPFFEDGMSSEYLACEGIVKMEDGGRNRGGADDVGGTAGNEMEGKSVHQRLAFGMFRRDQSDVKPAVAPIVLAEESKVAGSKARYRGNSFQRVDETLQQALQEINRISAIVVDNINQSTTAATAALTVSEIKTEVISATPVKMELSENATIDIVSEHESKTPLFSIQTYNSSNFIYLYEAFLCEFHPNQTEISSLSSSVSFLSSTELGPKSCHRKKKPHPRKLAKHCTIPHHILKFQSPPKYRSKSFDPFVLFQAIREFGGTQNITCWTHLAKKVGFEVQAPDEETIKKNNTNTAKTTSVNRRNSTTNVAVRVKEWMRKHHVGDFFDFCLGIQRGVVKRFGGYTRSEREKRGMTEMFLGDAGDGLEAFGAGEEEEGCEDEEDDVGSDAEGSEGGDESVRDMGLVDVKAEVEDVPSGHHSKRIKLNDSTPASPMGAVCVDILRSPASTPSLPHKKLKVSKKKLLTFASMSAKPYEDSSVPIATFNKVHSRNMIFLYAHFIKNFEKLTKKSQGESEANPTCCCPDLDYRGHLKSFRNPPVYRKRALNLMDLWKVVKDIGGSEKVGQRVLHIFHFVSTFVYIGINMSL
jgi:hypothetical protein